MLAFLYRLVISLVSIMTTYPMRMIIPGSIMTWNPMRSIGPCGHNAGGETCNKGKCYQDEFNLFHEF